MVFGTELRRRRIAAGLSLTGLAALVHYSSGHLSKVETGLKPPSTDLARRCDAALDAGGALARLARSPSAPAPSAPAPSAPSPSAPAPSAPSPSAPSVGPAGWAAGAPGDAGHRAIPSHPAAASVAAFRVIFDELRGLGQRLGPAVLLPSLVAQTHAVRALAGRATGPQRVAALLLAARFAEYTGWMAQEAGDDAQAAAWTDRAVAVAEAAGDREMAAYALVRYGLLALYRHDATGTVQLARRAQAHRGASPRIRGLAAQREAQGHALAGDYDACMRAIDRAEPLLSATAASGPLLGTTNLADPAAVTAGWCLFDLGRPEHAARLLDRAVARIPATAYRARSRYGARLAQAYAAAGEPERACAMLQPVLDAAGHVDSATIRLELRDVNRALNRWHRDPGVRATRLRLTAALHP